MAGISKKTTKNKNGTKVTRYVITYRDIYGTQHTSGYYKTKAEAQAHITECNDINPDIANITFEQIFKPYIELVMPKHSHTTQATYKLYISKHFNKLYPLKYNKISSMDLQKFIDDIEQTNTAFVAQLCLKLAKAVCNFAMKHKLIKENKFLAVEKVIVEGQDKHHLTEAEEREVLRCCKEIYPRHYAMLYTLMGTGMRIGELLALEISDINYEDKSIIVNKQYTKGKLKVGTKNPSKNVKFLERKVYITDDTIEVLKTHIQMLPSGVKLLFPSKTNSYICIENFRRRTWQPLLVYAGITKRVRLHDLRGSYADISLNNGASVKFTQNQLGHTKSQTTLDIYTKNSEDMIDKALRGLNGVLKEA